MMNRLFNLGLRGGGMVGKFLLILLLARILQPEEVGLYGLFTVTVSYAMFIIGLDFWTYSGRALLHAEKKMWPNMLRDQAALYACSYIVVFPLLGLIFVTGLLPVKYALVYYVLLTVEHLSQELNRLLVITGKPLSAGIFLFIRQGAWCYALVVVYLGGFAAVDLKIVLRLWVLADTLVIVGGICILSKLPWANLTRGINWPWIYQGLKVAALYFVGTLAITGMFTLDRYFVELFSGPKLLGVYTLFFGICASVSSFVDAAVFSFSYPKLVSLYKSGQYAAFKSAKRDLGRQTLIAITVLAPAAGLLIGPVLELLDKPLYLQHLPVFFLLLATNTLYVIGQIPHYALYAMGYDHSIVGANIAGLIAFIVLSMLLGLKYGICGVVTALLMAIALVGALKQLKIVSLGRSGKTAVNKL